MKTLWFLADSETGGLLTLMPLIQMEGPELVGDPAHVGPYVFTEEKLAQAALESETAWEGLEEAADRLVIQPGTAQSFLDQVSYGLRGAFGPATLDAFSLDADPFDLVGGLCPLTLKGAELADNVAGDSFWTTVFREEGVISVSLERLKEALGLIQFS